MAAFVDLSVFAQMLEEARLPAGGFDAFRYEHAAACLLSGFSFHPEVPKAQHLHIVRDAIAKAATAGRISAGSLQAAFTQATADFLRQPLQPFLYTTALSFALPCHQVSRYIRGIHVALCRSWPASLQQARANWQPAIPPDHRAPWGVAVAIATVHARSATDAAHRALEAIDLLRAYWNFALNRRIWMRLMSHPDRPVNRIRKGRVQTVHHLDGSAAAQIYWFDAQFREEPFPHLSNQHWRQMLHDELVVRKLVRQAPYREVIEWLLIRYVRALDSADADASFLKLWSLLEALTDTPADRNDVTIKRCLFAVAERETMRQILEHLRRQRNSAVHYDDITEETELLVFQLKWFVEILLSFHIGKAKSFRSFAEAASFLDLSADPKVLKRQIELREIAMTYQQ